MFPPPPPTALGLAKDSDSESEGPDVINDAALMAIPEASAFDTQVRDQHSYNNHRLFCMGSV